MNPENNYESWCIYNYIINTEEAYHHFLHMARELAAEENCVAKLAHAIKDTLKENIPNEITGIYLELIHAAIDNADFIEIAICIFDDE